MNDVAGLVYVTKAYMTALYTLEAEHTLNDVIALVDRVSSLFAGCDLAVRHLAVQELWTSMIEINARERKLDVSLDIPGNPL